jgi:hypothetical protein
MVTFYLGGNFIIFCHISSSNRIAQSKRPVKL